LAVNDLTRRNRRNVRVVRALTSLSLGRTFISCQVVRSFAARCFE
jgi:hypothetical protein